MAGRLTIADSADVRGMFGRIAPRYDLMNRLASWGQDQRWRRKAMSLAAIPSGGLALDVGVGTGDLALVLSSRGVRVVGLDSSSQMLSIGLVKASANGSGFGPQMVLGDAMALPFPDNTFDSVVSAFTLRNLGGAREAFREMARVVRTGGKVVCLEFVRPTNPAFRAIYFAYLGWIVPLVATVVRAEAGAYRYLWRSIRAFPTAEGLRAIMGEASLGSLRYHLLQWGAVAVHIGVKEVT